MWNVRPCNLVNIYQRFELTYYLHIQGVSTISSLTFNPLNAKLNPICHLLALLGAHHILHVNSLRVKNRASYI